MTQPEIQRFSSAYDQVTLVIKPDAVDRPQVNRAIIEDARYWMAGKDRGLAEEVYIRTAEMNGHLCAEPTTDVAFGEIAVSEPTLREMGIRNAPVEMSFLLARPGHAEQLERFYI